MLTDIACGLLALNLVMLVGEPFCRYYDTVRERPAGQGWH